MGGSSLLLALRVLGAGLARLAHPCAVRRALELVAADLRSGRSVVGHQRPPRRGGGLLRPIFDRVVPLWAISALLVDGGAFRRGSQRNTDRYSRRQARPYGSPADARCREPPRRWPAA